MALLCYAVVVLLFATVVADMDYGGVPLWINRFLGEPSVLSLQGRMDPAWFRANNPQACPQQCECPIQWPTALYCDQRGLTDIPDSLPDRTQYLFLQVGLHFALYSLHLSDLHSAPLSLYDLFSISRSLTTQNSPGVMSCYSQGNNISSLSLSGLANITGLRWLILDHNQLQSDKMDQLALQNQTKLCHLFANYNHLSSVPSALPTGLKQLRLAHNQISSIRPGAFQNLHNLTLLLLQGNRLKTITEGDLKGSVMISFLYICIKYLG